MSERSWGSVVVESESKLLGFFSVAWLSLEYVLQTKVDVEVTEFEILHVDQFAHSISCFLQDRPIFCMRIVYDMI